MSLASRLQTKLQKTRPPSILFNGIPKIGKTEMAAFAPNPVFAYDDKEPGIETLIQAGTVPASVNRMPPHSKWEDLLSDTRLLIDEQHDRKTFVYDTLGGAVRLCREWFVNKYYNGNLERFHGFGGKEGHNTMLPHFYKWLDMLSALMDRGMMVILLSHVTSVNVKDPSGDDFRQWDCDVHEIIRGAVNRWADLVIMADHVRSVGEDKKVHGATMRVLHTQPGPGFFAGGRYRLPSPISMGNTGQEGWTNFSKELYPRLNMKEDT